VIKEHGIEYEKGKFKSSVEDGTVTLERVKVILLLSFPLEEPLLTLRRTG